MTTTTTSYRDEQKAYFQRKLDRARARGRSGGSHRRMYADTYREVLNSKIARKGAAFACLEALLLWALTRDARRRPFGKRFTELRDWAKLAGFTATATITTLKRLHKEGRVEYTGGGHSYDPGLWHPIHTGAKNDLGRIKVEVHQIDDYNHMATCTVKGYGIDGIASTPAKAKRELAKRLAACGFTGTLCK